MTNNLLTDKIPFVETIYRLRNKEELVIFEKQLSIDSTEEKEVCFILETEYQNESTDYPFTAPPFHLPAALWAAKVIYFSAQLLLFREGTGKDIQLLFPDFKGQKTLGAQLSADIVLRFLPAIVGKLKEIDPEDPLIERLESILTQFPYSAVGYFTAAGSLQFDAHFLQDPCCSQLLVNRVVDRKDRYTAAEPAIKLLIESAMGEHQHIFWAGLHL